MQPLRTILLPILLWGPSIDAAVPVDSKLVLRTSPAGVAGRLMVPQPIVEVVGSGTVALPAGSVCEMRLLKGPGLLSGGLRIGVGADDKSFAFTDVEVGIPGVYAVEFAVVVPGQVNEITSSVSIDVAKPIPTALKLVTNNGLLGSPGSPLIPQPILKLTDQSGIPTPDPASNATCTISMQSPLTTLYGQAIQRTLAVDGVTFEYTDLRIDAVGVHTVVANATLSIGYKVSTTFVVVVDQVRQLPSKLVLESTPKAAAGKLFSTPISVLLVDSLQSPVPDDAKAVILLISGTRGGDIVGDTSIDVDVTKTRFVFENVRATLQGRYDVKVLVTLSSGVTMSLPISFDVGSALPQPGCVCQLQEPRGRAGVVLVQQPILALSSRCSGTACTDLVSSPNATIFLHTTSAPPNGALQGQTSPPIDTGRYQFSNLLFTSPGLYHLTATVRLSSGSLLPEFNTTLLIDTVLLPSELLISTLPRQKGPSAAFEPPLEVELRSLGGLLSPDPAAVWDLYVISTTSVAVQNPGGQPRPVDGGFSRWRWTSLSIPMEGVYTLMVSVVLGSGDVLSATVRVLVLDEALPPRGLVAAPVPSAGGFPTPLAMTPSWQVVDVNNVKVPDVEGLCVFSNQSGLLTALDPVPVNNSLCTAANVAAKAGVSPSDTLNITVELRLSDNVTILSDTTGVFLGSVGCGSQSLPAQDAVYWFLIVFATLLSFVITYLVFEYVLGSGVRSAAAEPLLVNSDAEAAPVWGVNPLQFARDTADAAVQTDLMDFTVHREEEEDEEEEEEEEDDDEPTPPSARVAPPSSSVPQSPVRSASSHPRHLSTSPRSLIESLTQAEDDLISAAPSVPAHSPQPSLVNLFTTPPMISKPSSSARGLFSGAGFTSPSVVKSVTPPQSAEVEFWREALRGLKEAEEVEVKPVKRERMPSVHSSSPPSPQPVVAPASRRSSVSVRPKQLKEKESERDEKYIREAAKELLEKILLEGKERVVEEEKQKEKEKENKKVSTPPTPPTQPFVVRQLPESTRVAMGKFAVERVNERTLRDEPDSKIGSEPDRREEAREAQAARLEEAVSKLAERCETLTATLQDVKTPPLLEDTPPALVPILTPQPPPSPPPPPPPIEPPVKVKKKAKVEPDPFPPGGRPPPPVAFRANGEVDPLRSLLYQQFF